MVFSKQDEAAQGAQRQQQAQQQEQQGRASTSQQVTLPSGPPPPFPAELSDLHCFTETKGVITSTMIDIPGYRVVKVLGAVYGLTVRSRNIAASLGMVLKSMAGGELKWFTNMVFSFSFPYHYNIPHISILANTRPQLYTARNDAIGRIVYECQARGGNAIIALGFDAGELGGFAQVCAYGTACVVEKIDDSLPDYPQLMGHSSHGSH